MSLTSREFTHPIVIGSGVAGLSVALALGRAEVVSKTNLGGGSSRWAQGGIASALGAGDSPAQHAADTIAVSAGLAEPHPVGVLTGGGPDAIHDLISMGARFDRSPDGTLALGREAGHGRRRIIHADGDATGVEIMRTLVASTRASHGIGVHEHVYAVDLLLGDGRVTGVIVMDQSGRWAIWRSPAIVIATGGIGQIYARTTNPIEVTGDGIAMAARAGAEIADMEFVQFHPTALAVGEDPMPLLTEALRGEGATLVDGSGRRYMLDEHPDAELAPRDVVARANYRRRGDTYLDARVIGESFPSRFPTVFAAATRAGLDPRRQLLPVSPAAHYTMGGIAADAEGRTSLPGLFAVGEASSTGVHGANRLASNSLLEGLVFGKKVAAAVAREPSVGARRVLVPEGAFAVSPTRPEAWRTLRRIMWEKVGVEREAEGLADALEQLEALDASLSTSLEGRNALTVARLVAEGALARRESRGAHRRTDYPEADPAQQRRRTARPVARVEPLLRPAVA